MIPNAMMFAVHLSQHARGPFVNDEPKDATPIWEARCIPGNLVGVGRTPQDAQRSLANLLEWTAKEEAFERWYLDAWSYADAHDIECFNQVAGTQQRRLQRPKKISEQFSFGMVPTCV